MKVHKLLYLIVLLPLLSQAAEVEIGMPTYGGSGCPQGSIQTEINQNSKSIHLIMINPMVAQLSDGKTIDRKSCNLAIPVKVLSGYKVALLPVKYEGYLSLQGATSAKFSIDSFIAGNQGTKLTSEFTAPVDKNITLVSPQPNEVPGWSVCGTSTILRINFSGVLQANGSKEKAMLKVDQIGDLKFQVKACGS